MSWTTCAATRRFLPRGAELCVEGQATLERVDMVAFSGPEEQSR